MTPKHSSTVIYFLSFRIRIDGDLFGHPLLPLPETGDVIMVDYLAAQGVAYFLLNGRKVSSEMPFRRAMKPWVGLGSKGMAVSTGEKMPGKVDKGVCDWCFTVLGEKGGTAPCTEVGSNLLLPMMMMMMMMVMTMTMTMMMITDCTVNGDSFHFWLCFWLALAAARWCG
jgi:hypothetical protein